MCPHCIATGVSFLVMGGASTSIVHTLKGSASRILSALRLS